MKRRAALQLSGVLFAVALGLVIFWPRTGRSTVETTGADGANSTATASGGQAALYFPAASGMLEAEVRQVPADLDPAARKHWLAEQLVAGPQSEGLHPALPQGTVVASVFAAPDGTVFVDFVMPERTGMGSTEELLALYSIVNTILLDDQAASRVVILVNGRQRETLAGHLDTAIPLAARLDLIREAG